MKNSRRLPLENTLKFIAFSLFYSALLEVFLSKVGMLRNMMIIGTKTFTGYRFAAIYLGLLLAANLWYIFVIGIRKHSWKKVFSAGNFPIAVMLFLRLRLASPGIFSAACFLAALFVAPIVMEMFIEIPLWFEYEEEEREGYVHDFVGEFLHEYLPSGVFYYILGICFSMMTSDTILPAINFYENHILSLEKDFEAAGDAYDIEAITEKDALDMVFIAGPLLYADSSKYYDAKVGHLWDTNKIGLYDLKESVYPKLSTQDKLNALQTLVEIESKALLDKYGVIKIAMGKTEDPVRGYYAHKHKTIVICEEALEDRDEAIEVVLHEMKHAHQGYVTDYLISIGAYENRLLDNTDLYEWLYEQRNYTSGEDGDYSGYFGQSIEIDAYSYSNEWKDDLIDYVEKIGLEVTDS